MRRSETSLSPAQLQAIYQAIPCGVLVQSAAGEILHVNVAAEAILGRSAAELLGRSTTTITELYGESGEAVPLEQRPGARAVLTGAPVRGTTVSIVRPDGERRWLQVDITPLPGADGRVEQIVASMIDVTERRTSEERLRGSEERFRSLVQNASDIIMVVGPTGDMRYVSPSMERVLGYAPGDLGGRSSFARMHPDDAARLQDQLLSGGLQTGLNAPVEIRIRHQDGSWRWFESVANNLMHDPSVGGIVINSRDITERRRADGAQRLLADAGALLNASQDEQTALDALVRLAVPLFADWCMVDLVGEDGELRRVARTHADPARLPALLEMEERYVIGRRASEGLLTMIRSGDTALLAPMPEETLAQYAADPGHRALLRELGIGSVISTPLRSRGKPLGAITFVVGDSERTYIEEDVRTAESLAGRIAMALDNIRLLAAERRTRQAAERAADRTARLQTITAALSEAVTPAQVADAVLDAGLPAVGASAGTIVLLVSEGAGTEGSGVEVAGIRGYSPAALMEWQRLGMDAHTPVWEVLHTALPLWIESREELIRDFPQMVSVAREAGHDAWAAVPLLVEGRVIGAIGIAFDTERPLDEDDSAFMQAIAQQCAQALERSRLYQAEHDARAAGLAAEQRLRFLSEATAALSASLEYEATLATVARQAVPLFADWCVVYIRNAEGEVQRLATASSDPEQERRFWEAVRNHPVRHDAERGVGHVVRSGRTEFYQDTLEPWFAAIATSESHLQTLRGLGLISAIIVPLIARGQIQGAIQFGYGASGRHYDEQDVTLVEELARRAAMAIDNATLYREASLARQQMQTVLENTPIILWAMDRNGIYTLNEGKALASIGRQPGEVVGRSVWDAYRDLPEIRANVLRALAGESFSASVVVKGRTFEAQYAPLRDANGEIAGVLGAATDITDRVRAEEALLQNEARFRSLVQHSSDIIVLLDEAATIRYVSPAVERVLGFSPASEVGVNLFTRFHVDDLARAKALLMDVLAHPGAEVHSELRVQHADGSWRDIEFSGMNLLDEPAVGGIVVNARDVTERRRAEDARRFLAEAGAALSLSLDFQATLAAIVDLAVPLLADWCAVDVLEAPGVIRRLAARTADPDKEPVTRALQEQYPPAWGAAAGVANVIRTGRPELYEDDLESLYRDTIRSEGHRTLIDQLGLRSRMIVPLIAHGETAGALSFGAGGSGRSYSTEDLALAEELARRAALAMENARLYQELTERKAQLQELLGRVLAAHEEERRRVAYEIHDGLAQIAVGAHQHLQAFAHRYQPRRPQARVELGRALELTQHTVREARRVIAGLRPTALDDFGLAVALRIECDALRTEGWDVTYQESLRGRRLPSAVETALFRVAQEAITNVRKHAQTRRVRVSLEPQGASVRLDVRDWGRGFRRSEDPRSGTPGERVGLAGMRERITLLDGRFRVHSWPGRGSHVIAEVPLKPADEREDRSIAPEPDAEGAIAHGE